MNVNKSMVWKFLDEDDIKPFRIRYYLEKEDPEFKKMMKEALMVYKKIQMGVNTEKGTGMVTLSFDEKPCIQAIGNIVDDLPVKKEHGFIGQDSEYVRHGPSVCWPDWIWSRDRSFHS